MLGRVYDYFKKHRSEVNEETAKDILFELFDSCFAAQKVVNNGVGIIEVIEKFVEYYGTDEKYRLLAEKDAFKGMILNSEHGKILYLSYHLNAQLGAKTDLRHSFERLSKEFVAIDAKAASKIERVLDDKFGSLGRLQAYLVDEWLLRSGEHEPPDPSKWDDAYVEETARTTGFKCVVPKATSRCYYPDWGHSIAFVMKDPRKVREFFIMYLEHAQPREELDRLQEAIDMLVDSIRENITLQELLIRSRRSKTKAQELSIWNFKP